MVPVDLPGKTTNQNICFIFQHGGILVGKWLKIVFYDEKKHTNVCMFRVWYFKIFLLNRLELTRRQCMKLESAI